MKWPISALSSVQNTILGLVLFPFVALAVVVGLVFGVYKWIRGVTCPVAVKSVRLAFGVFFGFRFVMSLWCLFAPLYWFVVFSV